MNINAINSLPQPSAAARPLGLSNASLTATAEQPVAAKAEQAASASTSVEPAREPLEEAVSSIKQFAQSIQRNLNFALDDSSGRVVVKVTDAMSGDVIRQIPSEDALRLAESLEEARSLLFKAEA